MADREYAPLSAVCVRTLSDKVYEKRKVCIVRGISYIALQSLRVKSWRVENVTSYKTDLSFQKQFVIWAATVDINCVKIIK